MQELSTLKASHKKKSQETSVSLYYQHNFFYASHDISVSSLHLVLLFSLEKDPRWAYKKVSGFESSRVQYEKDLHKYEIISRMHIRLGDLPALDLILAFGTRPAVDISVGHQSVLAPNQPFPSPKTTPSLRLRRLSMDTISLMLRGTCTQPSWEALDKETDPSFLNPLFLLQAKPKFPSNIWCRAPLKLRGVEVLKWQVSMLPNLVAEGGRPESTSWPINPVFAQD